VPLAWMQRFQLGLIGVFPPYLGMYNRKKWNLS